MHQLLVMVLTYFEFYQTFSTRTVSKLQTRVKIVFEQNFQAEALRRI